MKKRGKGPAEKEGWVQVGGIRVRADVLEQARRDQAEKQRREVQAERRLRARKAGGEANPRSRRRDT